MNIEHRTSNTCLDIAFAKPDRMLNEKAEGAKAQRQKGLSCEAAGEEGSKKMNIEHRTPNIECRMGKRNYK